MSKKQTLLALFAGFVMGLVLGLTLPRPHLAPSLPASDTKNTSAATLGTADLMIDFGDGELLSARDYALRPQETLFDLTREVAQEHQLTLRYDPPGEWGVFVKEIGGRKNGQANKYWQYWVNAEQVQVAADRYVLKAHDVAEWKFIISQPGQ